jgi:hypothetical protein
VTRVVFDAPLPFVFRWCTDYSPIDPKLEGEAFTRRVIERGRRRVVFEDIQAMESGWSWARYTVTLLPPDRWHMDSVGNMRHVVGDYTLASTSDGRTRFELRYRREPGLVKFRRVPKKERGPEDLRIWRNFKRALERDYRASLRGKRAGPG